MSDSLFDRVRAAVSDSRITALTTESQFDPITGAGTPVAGPTYAREKGDPSKDPNFAYSPDSFLPAPDAQSGWHSDLQRTADGTPRLAGRLVLDGVPAQSGAAETQLWEQQDRIGVRWPGFRLIGPDEETVDRVLSATAAKVTGGDRAKASVIDETRAALDLQVSNFELAHRHIDAWCRFADQPGGGQVWAGGEIKDLMLGASPENAGLLYEHFPNAAVFGYWLSSGTSRRHRQARAYSSQITGFGAVGVVSAATKLDATGGSSKTSVVGLTADGELEVRARKAKGLQASNIGLGQVPTLPAVRGYVCELILQQSAVSLPVLRGLRFADDPEHTRRNAAATVLTLMAMTGHLLAAEDGFLRSGCALSQTDERWGWRRRVRGTAPVDDFDVSGADEAAEALRMAIGAAEDVGLSFAEPITLRMSEAQATVVAQRVLAEVGDFAEKE